MRGGGHVLGAIGALACSVGEPRPAAEASEIAEQVEGEDELASGRADERALSMAPVFDAGRYVLRAGALELEVDPELGGRITRFGLSGENVLTGPEVVAGGEGATPNMFGSTFWTSPQGAWGWPPEAAIDLEPYRAEVVGVVLELTGGVGAATGYSVRKRLWAEPARERISVEYTLQNRRAELPAAPWEISRVPKEGFVFFPAAAAALPQSNLPSTFTEGVAWVDVTRAPPVDSKLFQDGAEGWLAYVARDVALIKVFDDLRAEDAAPGEAEVEVFVSGLYDYVEVEQQGRYLRPPAGGEASWQVHWLLKQLPPGLDASLGSRALVAWTRDIVAAAR